GRRSTSMSPATDRYITKTCSRAFVLALAVLAGTASAQDKARIPATYKGLPSEIPEKFEPTNDGFDQRPAGGDGPDEGWGEAAHRDPGPEGREGSADSAHANPLRCQEAHEPRRECAPRSGLERLRQRDGRDRRGGLHPGRPGRARQ